MYVFTFVCDTSHVSSQCTVKENLTNVVHSPIQIHRYANAHCTRTTLNQLDWKGWWNSTHKYSQSKMIKKQQQTYIALPNASICIRVVAECIFIARCDFVLFLLLTFIAFHKFIYLFNISCLMFLNLWMNKFQFYLLIT